MKCLTTLICSAAFLLGGCATTMDTFTDRNPAVDFSKYRSFSWIDEHPLIVGNRAPALANPLMESRIQDAISEELKALGYEFVPVGGEADLVVSFTVGARQEISVDSYPLAYRRAYIGDSVDVRSTTEGTLAIDFFDTNTKSAVWHGRAEKSLRKKDRERRDELVKEAVAAILVDFPAPAL